MMISQAQANTPVAQEPQARVVTAQRPEGTQIVDGLVFDLQNGEFVELQTPLGIGRYIIFSDASMVLWFDGWQSPIIKNLGLSAGVLMQIVSAPTLDQLSIEVWDLITFATRNPTLPPATWHGTPWDRWCTNTCPPGSFCGPGCKCWIIKEASSEANPFAPERELREMTTRPPRQAQACDSRRDF
ncbi:MAG: hypothetical protein AAB726_00670 [Patescibacteria group bacterium]